MTIHALASTICVSKGYVHEYVVIRLVRVTSKKRIIRIRFDASNTALWQAKHSQIYPLLSSMEEKQLLSSHWVQQSDKPDKKIYAITEKGMQKRVNGCTNRSRLQSPRMNFLRTFCLWLTEIGIAVDIFEDRRIGYLEKNVIMSRF